MATSSLLNLTVPTGSFTSEGLLMPKLAYRYRVLFYNFGVVTGEVTELTKQVMKFDRPHVQFEEIKLPIYNRTVKIAGKHSWTDVTCDLRDDASGGVSRMVGQQLQKQLDFLEQSSAASAIDYKFTTVLQILDGGNGKYEPVVLEQWNIEGCYLKDVNYNSMDYAQSEAVKVTMSITFDNAMQVNAQSGVADGVGADIGRATSFVPSLATGPGAIF